MPRIPNRIVCIATLLCSVAGSTAAGSTAAGSTAAGSTAVSAESIDGFLTPYESVVVATGETGVVQEILVREGDPVREGEVLVRLQDDIHQSLLMIAETAMNSTGRLEGAQAEFRMREDRLEKLLELLGRGSARQEEVTRAQADLEIAESRVRTIREELEIKRLEHERAAIQWARRSVRAPLSGVVLKLHKKPGEFVGAGDPSLITVVQLNPLLGVFAVPSDQARHISVGQQVRIRLTKTDDVTTAAIERVSPVIDGKSGTVRVELRVGNPQGRLYSGEPCELLLGTEMAGAGNGSVAVPVREQNDAPTF